MQPSIECQWESCRNRVAGAASEFGASHPGITSIALAGAWARGIVSDEDVDLVFVVRREHHVAELSAAAPALGRSLSLDTTSFVHSRRAMERMAGRRSALRPLVGLSRWGIELLKRFPGVKRLMKAILGSRYHVLQRYEILPETLQTLVPLYDPDGFLEKLLDRQRQALGHRLSAGERLLYSRRGFTRLLDAYLEGAVDQAGVAAALASWDVDAEKYLRRAVEQFREEDREALRRLLAEGRDTDGSTAGADRVP